MNKPFNAFKNTLEALEAGYEFNIDTQEYEPIKPAVGPAQDKKEEEKLPM